MTDSAVRETMSAPHSAAGATGTMTEGHGFTHDMQAHDWADTSSCRRCGLTMTNNEIAQLRYGLEVQGCRV